MRTPEIASEMMRKTVNAVHLPVSVKMRLGWDRGHINAVEMAMRAEDAGIAEITIHGRTREQQYSGKADWDAIREAAAHVHIPVFGNGDLFTARAAWEQLQKGTVAGVMIGRGAMGNPWIFRDIDLLLRGETPPAVTIPERVNMIRKHYTMMLNSKPEAIAVREMRKHIGWYIHGLRGAGKARDRINRAEKPDEVWAILDCLMEEQEESR